jgi:hypothetical protein
MVSDTRYPVQDNADSNLHQNIHFKGISETQYAIFMNTHKISVKSERQHRTFLFFIFTLQR